MMATFVLGEIIVRPYAGCQLRVCSMGSRFKIGSILLALGAGVYAGLLTTAYTALLLAGAGHFRAGVCIAAGIGLGMGAAWLVLRRAEPPTAGAVMGYFAAGAISLASLALTLPPGEWILGGWDPGVYVHTGAAIAKPIARTSRQGRARFHMVQSPLDQLAT